MLMKDMQCDILCNECFLNLRIILSTQSTLPNYINIYLIDNDKEEANEIS